MAESFNEISQHKNKRLIKDSNPQLQRNVHSYKGIVEKIKEGIEMDFVFEEVKCCEIEAQIEKVMSDANEGKFKPFTVDRTSLRIKYFFGERYTYGAGLGQEVLFPKGAVESIPIWIKNMIISPLELAGILPPGFVNSAVINVYLPGGCIVSHIDPPQIFERPIVSASFYSDTVLSFGCKFSFKPIRVSTPVFTVKLDRGSILSLSGFAADEITHSIRPQDVKTKRAAIILRRVFDDAPRLHWDQFIHVVGDADDSSIIYRIRRKRSFEEGEKLPDVRRKKARFDKKTQI